MTTQYVIRHNDFAYNDEWYQTHTPILGAIQAVYTDKSEAETAYKQLIVEALYHNEDLSNYDIGNGYADDATYENLEAFVLEKTGEEFDTDDEIPEMELEDAFQFAQIAGILHYQLIEIDQTQPIHILWSNTQNDYLKGEYNNTFDSLDENFADREDLDLYIFEDDFTQDVIGHDLNELSDSPELLKNLIHTLSDITYDVDTNSITEIDWYNLAFTDLKSLNALLKQSIFEVRQISLEQLNKISNGEENE